MSFSLAQCVCLCVCVCVALPLQPVCRCPVSSRASGVECLLLCGINWVPVRKLISRSLSHTDASQEYGFYQYKERHALRQYQHCSLFLKSRCQPPTPPPPPLNPLSPLLGFCRQDTSFPVNRLWQREHAGTGSEEEEFKFTSITPIHTILKVLIQVTPSLTQTCHFTVSTMSTSNFILCV